MMRFYQASTLATLLQLCTFSLAASPITLNTPNNVSLPSPDAANSLTLNLTLSTPRNPLPPQPYIYRVPHSTLKIKFQAFGHLIPPSNVVLCLLIAANDVNLHFASQPAAVGPGQLKISSATVRLNLYPKTRDAVTWAKWGATVRGITDFVTRFGFVDLDYYILDDDFGGGVIGGGLVSNR